MIGKIPLDNVCLCAFKMIEPPQKTNCRIKSFYSPIALIFCGVTAFTVFVYIMLSNNTLKDFAGLVVHKWYFLDAVISYYLTPFLNFIYIAIGLVTSFLAFLFFKKKFSAIKIFQFGIILAFILSLGLQTVHHFYDLKNEMDLVRNTESNDRPILFSKLNFPVSIYAKKYLPGKHSCELITDMDFSDERYMGNFVNLRYHLYPIDIYFNRNQPKNCIMVYGMEDPLQHIPSAYKAFPIFQNKHVLAIKQTP